MRAALVIVVRRDSRCSSMSEPNVSQPLFLRENTAAASSLSHLLPPCTTNLAKSIYSLRALFFFESREQDFLTLLDDVFSNF
jgi:hypothetical protein